MNGGTAVVVQQPNTGGGLVLLSVPVKLNLINGLNSITFSAGQTSKWHVIFPDDKAYLYPRLCWRFGPHHCIH